MTSIESAEPFVRLGIFVGLLSLFATLEAVYPRRRRAHRRLTRWPGNIGISALNQIAARIIVPATAVGLAAYNAETGVGIFNRLDLPAWLEIAIAILLLDLAIYLQHIMLHAVPVFWRLHRMHHADTDFDVTTGIRFHPISIVLSALIKLATVFVLGPAVVAVLVFEILLNATSLFNHSNLRVPTAWDRVIRYFIVTPDMHRVHHSVNPHETNSNFGFNFPWWDRIFGTYRAQPEGGHTGMNVGLDRFRESGQLRIDRMLMQPFRGPADGYSITRSGKNPLKRKD